MTPKPPRIFRNWYTRNGRKVLYQGWCVRIQHQGRRRTFSLAASSPKAARLEAEILFRNIRSQGWAAAPPPRKSGGIDAADDGGLKQISNKRTLEYWKQCLVFRPYKGGALFSNHPVFSARIEQDGIAFHCPLETDNAAKARNIHNIVQKQGWPLAGDLFPREFTLGIIWSQSPYCCTYTTLYSLISTTEPVPMRAEEGKGKKSIVVIEADASFRRAICACLNQNSEFVCSHSFGDFRAALDQIAPSKTDMVLLNRDLPEALNSLAASRIHVKAPGIPVWTYGIYEDSDPIFTSISGVRAGYILRRRAPGALLEPIFGAGHYRHFTENDSLKKIRDYFQNFFADSAQPVSEKPAAGFTTREQEIVSYICKGFIDKEIASLAGISVWTVRKHLQSIYRKLNVNTRIDAIIRLSRD